MPDAKAILNSDFLGRTYDVLEMDPLDLGSSSRKQNVMVLDFTEGDKGLSGDTYWIVPKGTIHTSPLSMHWETASTTMSSSYQFRNELKLAVDVDAGVEGGFEFSGSATSRQMEDVTQSRKRTYVYSRAYQEDHTLDLDLSNPNAPLQVTQEFQDAVLALPYQDEVPGWEKQFEDFIATWGTHFTTGIVLGGLAMQRTSGLASTYLKSTESEQTLKTKASVQYEAIKGGASTEASQQLASKTDQDYSLERVNLDCRGGRGSTSNISDQWIQSVRDEPTIVKAKLERLSYLLTARFFPGQDFIEELQGLLDRAITDWILTARARDKYKKAGPTRDTAPLCYGEPVVMAFPWADGKTEQIGVCYPGQPQFFNFPVRNGQPVYDENQKVALTILSGDGSNKDGTILAGDQVRIEVIDRGFFGRGAWGLDWKSNSSDALRFTILHRDDNLGSPGRVGEYFQGSDLVAFVPVDATNATLCLGSSDRTLVALENAQPNVSGFCLVRCAEQEES
jgi:hypothetical protein